MPESIAEDSDANPSEFKRLVAELNNCPMQSTSRVDTLASLSDINSLLKEWISLEDTSASHKSVGLFCVQYLQKLSVHVHKQQMLRDCLHTLKDLVKLYFDQTLLHLLGVHVLNVIQLHLSKTYVHSEECLLFLLDIFSFAEQSGVNVSGIYPLNEMTLIKLIDDILVAKNLHVQKLALRVFHMLLPKVDLKTATLFFPHNNELREALLSFKKEDFEAGVDTFAEIINYFSKEKFILPLEVLKIGYSVVRFNDADVDPTQSYHFVFFDCTYDVVSFGNMTGSKQTVLASIKKDNILSVRIKKIPEKDGIEFKMQLKNSIQSNLIKGKVVTCQFKSKNLPIFNAVKAKFLHIFCKVSDDVAIAIDNTNAPSIECATSAPSVHNEKVLSSSRSQTSKSLDPDDMLSYLTFLEGLTSADSDISVSKCQPTTSKHSSPHIIDIYEELVAKSNSPQTTLSTLDQSTIRYTLISNKTSDASPCEPHNGLLAGLSVSNKTIESNEQNQQKASQRKDATNIYEMLDPLVTDKSVILAAKKIELKHELRANFDSGIHIDRDICDKSEGTNYSGEKPETRGGVHESLQPQTDQNAPKVADSGKVDIQVENSKLFDNCEQLKVDCSHEKAPLQKNKKRGKKGPNVKRSKKNKSVQKTTETEENLLNAGSTPNLDKEVTNENKNGPRIDILHNASNVKGNVLQDDLMEISPELIVGMIICHSNSAPSLAGIQSLHDEIYEQDVDSISNKSQNNGLAHDNDIIGLFDIVTEHTESPIRENGASTFVNSLSDKIQTNKLVQDDENPLDAEHLTFLNRDNCASSSVNPVPDEIQINGLVENNEDAFDNVAEHLESSNRKKSVFSIRQLDKVPENLNIPVEAEVSSITTEKNKPKSRKLSKKLARERYYIVNKRRKNKLISKSCTRRTKTQADKKKRAKKSCNDSKYVEIKETEKEETKDVSCFNIPSVAECKEEAVLNDIPNEVVVVNAIAQNSSNDISPDLFPTPIYQKVTSIILENLKESKDAETFENTKNILHGPPRSQAFREDKSPQDHDSVSAKIDVANVSESAHINTDHGPIEDRTTKKESPNISVELNHELCTDIRQEDMCQQINDETMKHIKTTPKNVHIEKDITAIHLPDHGSTSEENKSHSDENVETLKKGLGLDNKITTDELNEKVLEDIKTRTPIIRLKRIHPLDANISSNVTDKITNSNINNHTSLLQNESKSITFRRFVAHAKPCSSTPKPSANETFVEPLIPALTPRRNEENFEPVTKRRRKIVSFENLGDAGQPKENELVETIEERAILSETPPRPQPKNKIIDQINVLREFLHRNKKRQQHRLALNGFKHLPTSIQESLATKLTSVNNTLLDLKTELQEYLWNH